MDTATEEDEAVMSEVHLGCPPNFSGPYFSTFTMFLPPPLADVKLEGRTFDGVRGGEPTSTQQVISSDEDGDLILTRRNDVELEGRTFDGVRGELTCTQQVISSDEDDDLILTRHDDSKYKFVMIVQHNITSSIPSVGLQVWRAELVLADYVMHKMFTTYDFDEIIAAELGAGTGLAGMLLARVAKKVFLTDHGDEVLDNCFQNVHLNSGRFSAPVYVRELNWKALWPPLEKSAASQGRYDWTSQELQEFQRASLLVAADVIYSDDLTDAFFSTLERLMSRSPDKVLYMALEKRYNFTLDDLSVVANGYSHFRKYLKNEQAGEDAGCEDCQDESSPCFVGKRIDLTQIPQYVREYERGEDVEIWEIKYER